MSNWKMYAEPIFGAVLFCSTLVVGSVSVATAEEAAESDDTAAKALVEKKCSLCHSVNRAYGADKTHSEWEKTVEKMMGYSEQMNFLNQKEKETVVDYLANRKIPQADSEK